MAKLIYFTASYPYGLGEEWKRQELDYIKGYFSQIKIVPLSYDGNQNNPRELPENVLVVDPLLEGSASSSGKFEIAWFVLKHFPLCLSELFSKQVLFNKKRFRSFLSFIKQASGVLKNSSFQQILRESDNETIWFFYWGRGAADSIPFIPKIKRRTLGVRLHRFDVFEYANHGYIPFRRSFYNKFDKIISVSDAGKEHIISKYPEVTNKVEVIRLGTKSKGLAIKSRDGILRIVSCSALVPVKRVHVIIEALRHIERIKIVWTHIGDGVLMDELKTELQKLPDNITAIFKGKVSPPLIPVFYANNPVDLFLNVSESEGVPISIMEAFSAGIPVMATDAGGTKEIVDDSVGKLLPNNISGKELAEVIDLFANLDETKKDELRQNAFFRFKQKCDAEVCTHEFIDYLLR